RVLRVVAPLRRPRRSRGKLQATPIRCCGFGAARREPDFRLAAPRRGAAAPPGQDLIEAACSRPTTGFVALGAFVADRSHLAAPPAPGGTAGSTRRTGESRLCVGAVRSRMVPAPKRKAGQCTGPGTALSARRGRARP